jgi:hypothetical protein
MESVAAMSRDQFLEFLVALVRPLPDGPAEALRNPVDVSVHREHLEGTGVEQDAFGHFVGDSGERQQVFGRRGWGQSSNYHFT